MDNYLKNHLSEGKLASDFSSVLSDVMNTGFEDEECMKEIYDSIGKFDKIQLLKRLASLRLFYENRNKATIIDAVMTIVLNWLNDNNWTYSGLQMSFGKFKTLIQKVNSSSLVLAVDPLDDPYLDRVLFYGNYQVLSGINSMSTYKLNIAIETLFKSNDISESMSDLENISKILIENLKVSTTICKQISVKKRFENNSREIFVPSQQELKKFEKFIVLETQSIYTEQLEINKNTYKNVTASVNDNHEFIKKPYLKTPQGILVLDVSSIANSLYSEIVEMFGIDFIEKFNSKIWQDVNLSLKNLGHKKVVDNALGVELINTPNHKEGLFTVSNDGLLFVICEVHNNTETLEDIDMSDRISNISSAYKKQNANKKLFALTVRHADIGASGIHFITRAIDVPIAHLSPFELKAISINEKDNLFIPRFLATKKRLNSFNGMNIYGDFGSMILFSENQMSMYVSDDVDYKQVNLAFAPEENSDYYEKMLENREVKLFQSRFNGNWYEGIRENQQGPFFVVSNNLRCFVESLNLKSIEIVTNELVNFDEFNLIYPIYDMISYWLSAYYSYEELHAEQLIILNFNGNIPILKNSSETYVEPLRLDIVKENGTTVFNINLNLFENLAMVSDNSIEKQIIRSLIDEFDNRVSEEKLSSLFEPKYKKKIAIHFDDEDGLLEKRIMERQQPQVSEYETSLLLDEIGEYLLAEGYTHGPLPEGKNKEFCHTIVDYLLMLLEREISVYTKESLLNTLLYQIEFLLSEQKNNERSYHISIELNPSQREKFLTQLNKDNENSLSTKFLLEYVASVKKFGNQQIDLWHLERLLAICALIMEWAHREDLFKYNLVSTKINFLESNRIGIKKSDFGKINEAFYNSREVQLSYNDSEDVKNEQFSIKAMTLLDDNLDLAFEQTFGYSNKQFQEVLSAVINIYSGEKVVYKVDSEIFLNNIYEFLEGSISKEIIQKVVCSITLSERGEFLTKVEGYQFSDTLPWIFNRELSFIRRPIISYENHFYFGVRNIIHMKKYVYQLLKEARLKSSSSAMKTLQSSLANILGEKFNQEIAQILTSYNLEVFTEVKKINNNRIVDSNRNELGDIDVLAINRKSKKIFIIETKNFNYARNPFEISKELEKVFTGKKSFVKKHLRRFEWIQTNFSVLKDHYHLKEGDWKIIPMFIISEYLIARDMDVDRSIKIISKKEMSNKIFK